jgi:hypothetical protein
MNKHPDDYVFGLDKDVQDKMKAKFDPHKQQLAKCWIEEVTGEKCEPVSASDDGFMRWLKDGIILCKLVNKINKNESDYKKKWKTKYSKSKMPFTQRENICNYIETCKKMGMKDIDCFVSQDLYDGDNPVKVVGQINGLGALAKEVKSYDGPQFGVKISKENKRVFDAETIRKGKCFVPLQNAGSIAVEKEKGTDAIVQYAKAGTDLGKSVGGVSQQNSGSIAVDKGKGTDHIVKYGIVGQEMGKSVGGVSQQNAGSIAVDKGKGTDHIVQYGKVGQEMGQSVGGVSQQNAGSIQVEKEKGTDHIVRYGKVGQEMGESSGGTSQLNAGSIARDKGNKLDNVSRALN